ncbi:hypothetical protein [Cellulomonas citrea]|uniref:hypothetical protein n=1 Tax=Cellulomonas citrea TaxID=1909423 RepID=UPI00135BBA16|nr:hypothetical protein [Cellulomonas citrea]
MVDSPRTTQFQLSGVRLYVPDEELGARLVGGTERLAAYIKTLTWVCTEYFGRLGRDFGSIGILIVVGVKPDGETRLWCEPVGGEVDAESWTALVGLLDGAGSDVRPLVTKPIAFAIEGYLADGPQVPFPEVPRAWVDALAGSESPVSIPDELFHLVFPS